MTTIDLILLIGIASAAVISWECKRGLLWLALLAVSYFVSGAYQAV